MCMWCWDTFIMPHISDSVWKCGVHFPLPPSFLLTSHQLRSRKRLTVWLADTGAPAYRTEATCPTWMLWYMRSRDILTWYPTNLPHAVTHDIKFRNYLIPKVRLLSLIVTLVVLKFLFTQYRYKPRWTQGERSKNNHMCGGLMGCVLFPV